MLGKDQFKIGAPPPESGERQFTEEIGAGVSELLKDTFFQQLAVNRPDTGVGRYFGRSSVLLFMKFLIIFIR